MKGHEIVWAYDRHRNRTATLRKHVTKYKYMQKWMGKFFRISQNRGIKIAWVNSIHMTEYIYLAQYLMCRSSRWRYQEDSFYDEATCYHSTMLLQDAKLKQWYHCYHASIYNVQFKNKRNRTINSCIGLLTKIILMHKEKWKS